VLFRSLRDAGLVDEVGVAVMPVLLDGGVPLLLTGGRAKLRLIGSKGLQVRDRVPGVRGGRGSGQGLRNRRCGPHPIPQQDVG
jgi:hypothetical protein